MDRELLQELTAEVLIRLKEAVESSNINQSEIARSLGVSPNVINRILTKKYKGATIGTIAALADAVGYEVNFRKKDKV